MKLLVCGDLISTSAKGPGVTPDKYTRGDSGDSGRMSFRFFAAKECIDFCDLPMTVLHTPEFSEDCSADLIRVAGREYQQHVARLQLLQEIFCSCRQGGREIS